MKKITNLIIMFISIFLFTGVVEAKKITVKFNSCVDGDTAKFTYKNEIITARFLAIDTPETKHPTKGVEPWGKEASDYTCDKLTNASKISLEYDSNSDETDKYSRHLVWVWVDNQLLQKELIDLGYAKVAYLYGDYKYTSELKEAEKVATKNKVGIWSDEEKEVSNNTSNETNTKQENTDNNDNYSDLLNKLIYTKDGKLNYFTVILAIIFILVMCIVNKQFRKNTVNTIKKEIKKKL